MNELIKIQKSAGGNSRRSLCGQVYDNFAFRLERIIFEGMPYNDNEINYANHMDYFQYHYSRYLCRLCKSGHRAFFEFRAFVSDPLFRQSDYDKLLEGIEQFLLEREMYESLVIFVKTNKKFKKELQNERTIKY